MGDITRIPNELLASRLLNPAEKIVWMGIRQHDWDNGRRVFPSAVRLAQVTGLHRSTIIRAISSLESKGFVSVTRKNGEANQYHLATGSTMEPVAEKHHPVAECDGAVAECDPKYTQEIDSINKPITMSRKDRIEASRKKAEEALDALDLDEFREKYPTIDVDLEFQQCKDHHLAIQANFHGPKRRTDWKRTFHTWCRNAMKWNKERGSPASNRNFDWRIREEDVK